MGKTKAGKKLVDKIRYRVKRLPNPIAFVGPTTSFLDPYHSKDTISIRNLYRVRILRAFLVDSDYDADFKIISYAVSVLRNGKEIFCLVNEGAAYSDSLKKAFNNVEINDILRITNIKCFGSDRLERTLAPLEFFIAD